MTKSSKPTNEQLSVVGAGGHLLVRACPGAGKTRTMVALGERAAATGGARSGVAFLSFTNAAVDELNQRLCDTATNRGMTRAPHYTGTFDAFLIKYVLGPDGHSHAPGIRVQFRDHWGGHPIRFKAGKTTMSVPLDVFLPNGRTVRLDKNRAPHGAYALRAFLERLDQQERERLCEIGNQEVRRRLKAGILTSPFLRSEARKRLGRDRANAHLAARFHTVIVDEAQDCDAVDLEILDALKTAGCRCVVVADPEQAIFRWRDADPARLSLLGFPEMRLTGNFRSSDTICRAAATLRSVESEPDTALGPAAMVQNPVIVVPFSTDDLDSGKVLAEFTQALERAGIDTKSAAIVAHREAHAGRVLGIRDDIRASESFAAVLARGSSSSASSADRTAAVQRLQETLASAFDPAARQDPNLKGWIHHTARQVMGELAGQHISLSGVCKSTRKILAGISAPPGQSFIKEPAKCFTAKGRGAVTPSSNSPGPLMRYSTVHAVKGREYDAVLVVVGDTSYLDELVDAWRARDPAHEGRAVLYVAATRARRLLVFAVPARVCDAVAELLRRQGAPVQVASGARETEFVLRWSALETA
ncbi:MAG: UvrD-helicase domain-containing protein [Myxococcales bacterium]